MAPPCRPTVRPIQASAILASAPVTPEGGWGLALIAPVLSSSLDAGIDRATLGATRAMLTTDLDPLREAAGDVGPCDRRSRTRRCGQVPDLGGAFDERGAEGDNSLAQARDQPARHRHRKRNPLVPPRLRDRRLLLAALAGIPAVIVVGRSSNTAAGCGRHDVAACRRSGSASCRSAPSDCSAPRWWGGVWSVGEFTAEDPCTAGSDPYPGD